MGSRLDGADLHSSISCSFTTLFQYWSRTHKVALLLSLPTKHLLKNPFLPYDSLDSSDGVQNRGLFTAGPRRQVAELCQRICRRLWLHPTVKRGCHHCDVTLWYEAAFRHLLELETALQNGIFGWNHGRQYGGSICNGYRRLLQLNPSEGGSTYHASLGVSFDRPAITSGKKIVKEDCRLGWSECDGSYHGEREGE